MKVRRISLAKRIIITLTILLALSDALIGGVVYKRMQTMFLQQVRENAMNLARCAAGAIEGDSFVAATQADKECGVQVLDTLSLFLENSTLEYVYSFGMDENGQVYFVVDADPEEPAEFGTLYDEVSDGMLLAFSGETCADYEPTSDEWGTYLSAYSPIYKGEMVVGIVGVDVSYSDVETSIQRLVNVVVFICIIAFAIMFIALLNISKKMKKGFVTLNDKVIELADGSGDLSKKIELRTGDELEVIGESINTFIGQLHNLVDQVADSSKSNADGIRDINNNTLTLSANMQECSASTETVSQQLERTAANVEELARAVEAAGVEVTEAYERAKAAVELASEHKLESEQQIEELQKGIAYVLEQSKAVEQVKQINEEVVSIVSATRILSINAQIEAARAGEAGRGFAVVAMQVAELSENISEAVGKIGEINDQVIHAMRQMASYLDNMNVFLRDNIARDYAAFEEIGKDYGYTTESMHDKMEELQQQSAQIATTVHGVSESISDISIAVSDSATQIEQLCNATVDMSDGVDALLNIPILQNK